ncbi:MAG: hypothetical protein ACOYBW_06785 [Fluviibacter phosphoraccumulans]
MAVVTVVREVLHDGSEGNTYLVKAETLEDAQKLILEASGCASIKLIGEIMDRKTINTLSEFFGIDIAASGSFRMIFNWNVIYTG